MKILFLDDGNTRHSIFRDWCQEFGLMDVTHVHTSKAAIRELKENRFDAVFLDHDLNLEDYRGDVFGEGTGSEVSAWVRDNLSEEAVTLIVVHSYNAKGAARMVGDMTHWQALWSPFGPGLKRFLRRPSISA